MNETFEEKVLEKYFESFTAQDGGLNEAGIETKLIAEILKRKKEENRKENVLVIDDLDRIDPEHIFRILNVFAAHFDSNRSFVDNKFGFDKIVIICDIDNVRNIFQHKFGVSVDFSGYIDKFFSHSVFQFLNRDLVCKFAENILHETKWINHDYAAFHEESIKNSYVRDSMFLETFIAEFAIQGLINMRSIVKWTKTPYLFRANIEIKGRQYSSIKYGILVKIFLLAEYAGSIQNLIELIQIMDFKHLEIGGRPLQYTIQSLIALILRLRHRGELTGYDNFGIGELRGGAKLGSKSDAELDSIVFHKEGITYTLEENSRMLFRPVLLAFLKEL